MTVRAKILGGFIMVFIVGLILGVFGLISTNMLSKLSDEQYALQQAGAGVSSVLNAHYNWRHLLTQAALNGTEFTGSTEPDTCALGVWRHSDEAKTATDPEFLALLNQLDAPHTYIHNEAKVIKDAISAGDLASAKQDFMENVLPQTEEAIRILTEMEKRYDVLIEEKGNEIMQTGDRMTGLILIIIAVGVLLSVLLAWKITASIMNPLHKMTRAAETIATGDLDISITYPVNDEIGQLTKSFQNIVDSTKKQVDVTEALASGDLTVDIKKRSDKDAMSIALQKMVDSLNKMFSDIAASAGQVSSGSSQIADGAQMLAQGATEQSATVQQLSASVVEVSAQTKQNAHMANDAKDLGESIKQSAEQGSNQMEQMMIAVQEINESSKSIGKVIKIIDDIAFQTNILALNAAVEAARAGQHGKGFAVVADEVRSLAAKSAEAAKNTNELIESSIKKAEQGASISSETAESLHQIVDGILRTSELITEISKSSNEQSVAISQISEAIDQVSQVVQQNSATSEESAAASEEMSSQASILQQLISQFKLKNHTDAMQHVVSGQNKNLASAAPIESGMSLHSFDSGKY